MIVYVGTGWWEPSPTGDTRGAGMAYEDFIS
jgi:hypothetical protein